MGCLHARQLFKCSALEQMHLLAKAGAFEASAPGNRVDDPRQARTAAAFEAPLGSKVHGHGVDDFKDPEVVGLPPECLVAVATVLESITGQLKELTAEAANRVLGRVVSLLMMAEGGMDLG
jgi:hypothetical protein